MRNKNFKLLFNSNNYIKYFFTFFIALFAVFFSLNRSVSASVTLYSQIGSVELGGSLCGGEYSSTNTLPPGFNASTYNSVTAGLSGSGVIASPVAVNGQTTVSQSMPVSSVQQVGVSVPAGFNTGENLSSVTFVATDRYTGTPLGTVTVPAGSCSTNSGVTTCGTSIPGLPASGNFVISSHLDYQRVTTPACGNSIYCPTSANVCRYGSCQSVTLNNTGFNGTSAETCPVVGTCSSNAECETQIDISALPNSQSVSPGGSVSYAVSVSVGGVPTPLNFTFNCPAGLECRIDAGAGTSGLYAPMRFNDPDDDGNWDGVGDANTGGGLGAAYSSYSTTDWRTGTINFSMYLPESLTLLVRTSGGTVPNTYPISMNAKSPDGYRSGSWFTSPTCGGTCTDTASVDLVVQNPPCSSLLTTNPSSGTCTQLSATSYRINWEDWSGTGAASVNRQVFRAHPLETNVDTGLCAVNGDASYDPTNCKDIGLSSSYHDLSFTTTNLQPGQTYWNRAAIVCNNGSGTQVLNLAKLQCSTLSCNPVTYSSANSGVSSSPSGPPTNSLTTTVGSTYYAFCDFGVNSSSISPPSGCAWINSEYPANVNGTRYRFTCSQSSAGTFTATCQNSNNAPQYYCADSRDVATVTVNGGVCTPNDTQPCASVDGSTCTGSRTCNGTGTAWGACSYASSFNSVCDDSNVCTTAGTSLCNNAGSCQTGTASGGHCVANSCVANTTASCSGTSCNLANGNADCLTPVNGVCGNASGKTYPNGTSGYAPDVQCSAGNSSNTAFPSAGSSVTWVCNGENGGSNSVNCSASQAAPVAPVVDIKCNVADNCTIVSGGSASLTWTSTNATSCTVTPGNYTGTSNLVGQSTGALSANTTYTINCSGPGGSGSDTTTVTVTPAPDFSISHSPASQTITQGQSTSFTITLTSLNGFSGAVNFASVGSCPNNASCTFSPTNPVVPNGGSISTTLVVTSQATASTGSFNLSVTATDQASGSLSHSTSPLLIVNTAGVAPSITLNASPNPVDYNTPTSLTWSTTGTQPITCNSTAGPWSVVGGGSGNSATYISSDTTTSGNWKTVYGADGYNVLGGTQSYPSYVTVTPSGNSFYSWADPTSDIRAPYESSSVSTRAAATWYSATTMDLNINITDGNSHKVAIYMLDWDTYQGGRNQTVNVLDANTLAVLDTRTYSSFTNGVYGVWNVSGHVIFRFTNNNAPANLVISGIFFDPGTGGSNNGSGTVASSNLTSAATFTLQCTNAFGSDTESVTVNVRPQSPTGGGGGGGSACNQIVITWTPVGSSVDGYRVYRNSSNNFASATNISGNLTNGTTASTYTDTTAASSNNYYWVVSYKGSLESAPLNITSSPLGATSCNADINGNKDITKVNGTAPSGYLPNAYSNNETPGNVVYNKLDIVTFSVNLPNQVLSGGETASNVLITDTLLNLRKPTAGWNMKIGATSLVEETAAGSYCSGTNYTTLAANHFVACGTAPNQTLYIKVNNIAQGGITSITYNAEIYTTSTQSSSRFKDSVEINYTSAVSGANLKSLASTPLIVFNVSNVPSIIETAP